MNNSSRSPMRRTTPSAPTREGFELAVARHISEECIASILAMLEHALDLKCYGLHQQSAQLVTDARSLAKRSLPQPSPEFDRVIHLCNRLQNL